MLHRPPVSIGLPVYNGENFIEAAIDSILKQTFADFELIISDNASTDRTAAICLGYAERDCRVRFYRNERNLGAAPNFNRTFELASGKYFKWMAYDDVLAPDFLAMSVAALEADPEAILCYSAVDIIDSRGDVLYTDGNHLPALEGAQASKRFGSMILPHQPCWAIFGLIRTEALRGSSLMQSYTGADRALLVELALRGRFVHVAKPLFGNRDHPQRYERTSRFPPEGAAAWWDTRRAGEFIPPFWTLYKGYWRMVTRRVPAPAERLRCYGHLLRWLGIKRHLGLLAADFLGIIDPRLFTAARAAKRRLLGPSKPLRAPIVVRTQGLRRSRRRNLCSPRERRTRDRVPDLRA